MIVQLTNNNIFLNNNINNLPKKLFYQGKQKKKKKRKQKADKDNVSFTSNQNLTNILCDVSENQKIITKIATLNIRHITDIKLQAVLNYMKKYNIIIMGLIETQKSDKEIKFLKFFRV